MYSIDNVKPRELSLFLAKPDKTTIAKLKHVKDKNMVIVHHGEVNELSFTIPYYIDINNELVRNPHVDKIKTKFLVRSEYGNETEWFIVDQIVKKSDDSDDLEVTCYSLAYQLQGKMMIDYDVKSYNCLMVMQDVLKNTGWEPGHINSDFNLKYRQFDVSSQTRLDFIFDIAETYDAVVRFDTVEKKVNFYKKDEITVNKGLKVGYGKYVKNMEETIDAKEVVTRLFITGSDDLKINPVNPTGKSYIDDFSYFIYPFEMDEENNIISHSDYMSDNLAKSLINYNKLVSNNKDKFSDYLDQKKKLQENKTKQQNKLAETNIDLEKALDSIKLAKELNNSTSSAKKDRDKANSKIKGIDKKISEIDSELKNIENNIDKLKEKLDLEKNLNEAQLEELSNFVQEVEWSDDNLFDANDLYESGLEELKDKNTPPIDISLSLVNFLEMVSESHNWGRFAVGDIIGIDHEKLDINVTTTLSKIEYDFEDASISVKISNTEKNGSDEEKISRAFYTIDKVNTDHNKRKINWEKTAENFNIRNDRVSTTPAKPKPDTIKHKPNDDGSVNLNLKWDFSDFEKTDKDKDNIDGFLIYLYADDSNEPYQFGSTMADESIRDVAYSVRSFTFPSVPANLFYTVGIQAYRRVDPDINRDGIVKSSIVKFKGQVGGLASQASSKPLAQSSFRSAGGDSNAPTIADSFGMGDKNENIDDSKEETAETQEESVSQEDEDDPLSPPYQPSVDLDFRGKVNGSNYTVGEEPENPQIGDVWISTSDSKTRIWEGTRWSVDTESSDNKEESDNKFSELEKELEEMLEDLDESMEKVDEEMDRIENEVVPNVEEGIKESYVPKQDEPPEETPGSGLWWDTSEEPPRMMRWDESKEEWTTLAPTDEEVDDLVEQMRKNAVQEGLEYTDEQIKEEAKRIQNDLKEQTGDINKKIDSLNSMADGLFDNFESIANHVEKSEHSYRVDKKHVKENIDDLRDKEEELRDRAEEAKKRVEELKDELEKEKNHVRERIGELSKTEEELKEHAKEAEERVDALKSEVADEKERVQKRIKELNDKKEELLDRSEKAEKRLDDLKDEVSDYEEKTKKDIESLQGTSDDLNKKANNLQEKSKDLDERVVNIDKDVDELEGTITTTIEDLEKIDDTVSENKTQISIQSDALKGKVESTEYEEDKDGLIESIEDNKASIKLNKEGLEAKAEKSEVDNLTGKVSDAESSIKTNAEGLKGKAEKKEVYTKNEMDEEIDVLNEKVVDFEATVDKIGGSVSDLESDLDSASGEIKSLEKNVSKFEIRADGIESSIKEVDKDVDGLSESVASIDAKADGIVTSVDSIESDLNGRIKDNSTEIETLAGQIEVKLDSNDYKKDKEGILEDIESNKTDIKANTEGLKLTVTKEEFEDMEVSVRNLIKNSAFSDKDSYWKGEGKITDEGVFSDRGMLLESKEGSSDSISNTSKLDKGKYVATIWYKHIEGDVPYLYKSGNSKKLKGGTSQEFEKTREDEDPEWKSITLSFEAEENNAEFYSIRYASGSPKDNLEGKIIIGAIKVGKGTKATDWSPAPDDASERISKVEATIDVHADSIEAKAEKSELKEYVKESVYSDKMSSLEVAIDGIKGSVSDVETDIDNATGDIKSLKKDFTTFEVRADGIESSIEKVDESVDGLSKSVNKVEAKADGIITTIGDLESDLDGKIEENSTKIETHAGEIEAKLESSTYKKDKEEIVDDIEENKTNIRANAEGLEITVSKEEFKDSVSETNNKIEILSDGISSKAEKSEVYSKDETDDELDGKVGNKVFKEQVNSLESTIDGIKGSISDVESDIGDTNDDIKSIKKDVTDFEVRADGIEASIKEVNEDVDGVSESVSKVEAKADGIVTTVDNLESDLDGKIEENSTEIKTLAGEIEIKLDSSTYKEDKEGIVSDIESNSTDIKANTDGLKLTVTKEEFEEGIENIKVGGRNLLKNSLTFESPWDNRDTGYEDVFGNKNSMRIKGDSSWTGYRVSKANMDKFDPDTYTFSMWVKADQKFDSKFGYRNGSGTIYGKISIPTEWTKIQFTFTTDEETDSGRIIYWSTKGLKSSKYMYASYPMLEKGNKVTDWSPAPEDAIKRITDVEATLDIQEDAIKAKAEASELKEYIKESTYSEKIGELETSIDGIKGSVSDITSEVDNATGDIKSLKKDVTNFEVLADGIEANISKIRGDIDDVEEDVLSIEAKADSITTTMENMRGDLNDDIESNKTEIKTQAGQIEAKLEKKEYKSDKSEILSDIEENTTNIKANTDGLKLTVTKEEFEDLEVGGINLLKHTDFSDESSIDDWVSWLDFVKKIKSKKVGNHYFMHLNITSDVEKGDHPRVRTQYRYNLTKGKKYTVSWLAFGSGYVSSNPYGGVYINGSTKHSFKKASKKKVAELKYNDLTKKLYKYTHTFEFKGGGDDDVAIYIGTEVTTAKASYFLFTQPQLEEGSKATSWSSNPDEISERISKTETEIEILDEGLKMKAEQKKVDEKVDHNEYSEKIANFESTINGIKGDVSDINSTVDGVKSDFAKFEVKADNISSQVSSIESDLDDATEEMSSMGEHISSVEQKANSIESTVKSVETDLNGLNKNMTKAESKITQNADKIEMKVDVDGIVSSLNLSEEGVLIDSHLIEMNGLASFINNLLPRSPKAWENGYISYTSGSDIGNRKRSLRMTTYIKVNGGEKYTMSIDKDSSAKNMYIREYYGDKKFNDTSSKSVNNGKDRTITLDSKTEYVKLYFNGETGDNLNPEEFGSDLTGVFTSGSNSLTWAEAESTMISGGSLITGSITTKQLDAVEIFSNSAIIAEIQAGSVNTAELSATQIRTGTLDAGKISVKNLSASSLISGEIDASKIRVRNINAEDIKTGRIQGIEVDGVTGTFGDVSVRDGDFTLISHGGETEYTIIPQTNLALDHSYEMVQTATVPMNTEEKDEPDLFYIHKSKVWGISGEPLITWSPPQESVAIFGEKSAVVNKNNYFYQRPKLKPNKTYTLSAYFKSSGKGSTGTPMMLIYIKKGTVSDHEMYKTMEYKADKKATNKPIRHSFTFTTPNVSIDGEGYYLGFDIKSTDGKYVMTDGIELVEGKVSGLYQEHNDLWNFLRGNGVASKMESRDLSSESADFYSASTKYLDVNRATIDELRLPNLTEPLWTGRASPTSKDTIKPKKKITDCAHGWALMWQRYKKGSKEAPSQAYQTTYIHKATPNKGIAISTKRWFKGDEIFKYVYLKEGGTKLEGHDNNYKQENHQLALTAIVEW